MYEFRRVQGRRCRRYYLQLFANKQDLCTIVCERQDGRGLSGSQQFVYKSFPMYGDGVRS